MCCFADLRQLFWLFLTSLILLSVVLHPAIMWMPFLVFSIFICNVINHNITHRPLFRTLAANRAIGVWLSAVLGYSSARIAISHIYNHHRHYRTQMDWMHQSLAGSGFGIARLLRYAGRCLLLPGFSRRDPALVQIPSYWDRQLKYETLALWCFRLGLLSIAGWKIFLLLSLQQLLAVCAMMGINLLQHEACELRSEFDHSRNFTSPVLNWFLFNNGFHTAHHLQPELHWSELAALHRSQIHDKVQEEFKVDSFWQFLLGRYLFEAAPKHHSISAELPRG